MEVFQQTVLNMFDLHIPIEICRLIYQFFPSKYVDQIFELYKSGLSTDILIPIENIEFDWDLYCFIFKQ